VRLVRILLLLQLLQLCADALRSRFQLLMPSCCC
jgi:hypothetical protein